MTENQPMYIMEDVSSPLKVECSSNINIRMRNNYSPPDLMSFFPSAHQTDIPLYCFYSMTSPNTEHVFLYAVIGLRVLRIHPAVTSQVAATINSPPGMTVLSFHRHDQTDAPLSLFYSMTFPNTERVRMRSHWPSGTPYPPGDEQSGCGDDQFAT